MKVRRDLLFGGVLLGSALLLGACGTVSPQTQTAQQQPAGTVVGEDLFEGVDEERNVDQRSSTGAGSAEPLEKAPPVPSATPTPGFTMPSLDLPPDVPSMPVEPATTPTTSGSPTTSGTATSTGTATPAPPDPTTPPLGGSPTQDPDTFDENPGVDDPPEDPGDDPGIDDPVEDPGLVTCPACELVEVDRVGDVVDVAVAVPLCRESEIPGNGRDDDCDGVVDELDQVTCRAQCVDLGVNEPISVPGPVPTVMPGGPGLGGAVGPVGGGLISPLPSG